MHFALALLIAVSAGETPRQAPRFGTNDPARMYMSYRGDRSGDAPNCLADTSCMGYCGPGVYDGGTEWQCVAGPASDGGYGTGGAVAVTQGTGATYEGGPLEGTDAGAYSVASDITDAKAPFVTAVYARAWLGSGFWSGDHTVVVVGSPTTVDNTNPVILSHSGGGSVSGFWLQPLSGTGLHAQWNASGTNVGVNAIGNILNGWSVFAAGHSGTDYFARMNGTQATVSGVSAVAVAPIVNNLNFGRYESAGFASRGPLWRVYFYNAAKSSTELAAIEAGIWGAVTNRGSVTATRSGAAYAQLADGYVYPWGDNAPRVDPRYGVLSFEARTSLWAHPTTICSSTSQGTPGCSVVAAGPFSKVTGANEVAEIVDDDAAAFEGKYETVLSPTLGTYVFSCSAAKGQSGTTRDKIRMIFGSDGTISGTTACSDPLVLTDSFTRFNCPMTLSGSPTYFTAVLYVGNGPADSAATGSVRVSECDLVKAPFAGPPLPTTAAVAGDAMTISTAGWPKSSGEVSIDVTPLGVPTQASLILDSRTTYPGDGIALYYDQNGLYAQVNGGNQLGGPVAGSVTWTPGVTYHVRLKWSATSTTIYRDGVALASATTFVPTTHNSVAGVGAPSPPIGAGNQANAYLKNLCVGTVGRCP